MILKTIEEVSDTYNKLISSKILLSRNRFTKLLLDFQDTKDAWIISRQLLQSESFSDNFYGIHVMYMKLLTQGHTYYPLTDFLQYKADLFRYLVSKPYNKLILNKLCCSIALIVIHTVSIKPDFADELIGFTLSSEAQYSQGISILKSIPEMLNDPEINIEDKYGVEVILMKGFNKIVEFVSTLCVAKTKTVAQKKELMGLIVPWVKLNAFQQFTITRLRPIVFHLYHYNEIGRAHV